MGVGGGVKLRGRDGGHAELHDQEPAEPEIPRSVGHLRGEVVVGRHLDTRHVDQHEVTAFGLGVLNCFSRGVRKGLYVGKLGIGLWDLKKKRRIMKWVGCV